MAVPVKFITEVVGNLKRLASLRTVFDKVTKKPAAADSEVAADPQGRNAVFTQDLGVTTRIVTGLVVDSLAVLHGYKVQPDGGAGMMYCTFAGTSSNSFIGARPLATLVPGSRVWVLVHPGMSYGVIICTEPDFSVDGRNSLSDFITTTSRAGSKVDDAHSFVTTMAEGSGIIDFNNGRPFDGTCAGEWGHITETGLRFYLDSFMAQVAVNEACGVFAFLFDNMLRLAGHNLQIRTAGSELEALDDQGEFILQEGFTPYTWEHKGVFSPTAAAGTKRTAQASQIDEQHYAELEPRYDDQMPFPRIVHAQGYLAQGGQRKVQLPPKDVDVYRHESNPGPAVFSEDIALTGRYSLRSAKAITIAKRVPMINPKRMRRPEATDPGDTEKNYSFASAFGGGDSPEYHTIRDELAISGGYPHSLLTRAAGVMDAHAFTFNWEANHAYWYHREDWNTPQEADGEISGHYQSKLGGGFGSLKSQQYLSPPPTETYKVDHRYGDGTYHLNESSIDLLEDGGVVIADGFGSELRMTGGQIFLSAPGDIWMKSGRNTNIWAGQDAIVRAKNSVDVTASDRDVRLKAEKNMQLLAGNGTNGGILLESRGSNFYAFAPRTGEDVVSGGVVIKSSNANTVVLGDNIYMRSGLQPEATGEITLDCSQGRGLLKTNTKLQEHFVRSGVWWFFCDGKTGENVGKVTAGYEFGEKWASMAGGVGINGHVGINGVKVNKGWDLVIDGHYASTMAEINPYVSWLTDTGKVAALTDAKRFLAAATVDRQKLLVKVGTDQYKSQFVKYWYLPRWPGNTEKIQSIGFSLRENYGTRDFTLYEDRWQQLSRMANEKVGTWTENGVPIAADGEHADTITHPHPGNDKWAKEARLYELDLKFTEDGAKGLESAPVSTAEGKIGDPYTDSTFETPAERVLDGNYRIVGSDGGTWSSGEDPADLVDPVADPVEDPEAVPPPVVPEG